MSLLDFWKPAWKRYPNPPVMLCSDEAKVIAGAQAAAVGGLIAGSVAFTGSMLPTLQGGDWVVLDPVPHDQLREGDIVTYKAEWNPAFANVIHRLLEKDGAGWIASGDNNPYSEAGWRITPDNYHAKCVLVFRFPQPQPVLPT